MNANDKTDDNGTNGRVNENNNPIGMDETGKLREKCSSGCDCGGKGCSDTKSSHDEQSRNGINDNRPKNLDGDDNEKTRIVITEMRNVADRLETGELKLMEARAGKIQIPGKGKQKPAWNGHYGLSVVYK